MGRGRNGLVVQNPIKHRKSIATNFNNKNFCYYNRANYVQKENLAVVIDPNFLTYLRSLDPRKVVQTVLTRGSSEGSALTRGRG